MFGKKKTKWGWLSSVYTEDGPGKELGFDKDKKYVYHGKVVTADCRVVERDWDGLEWTGLSARLPGGGGSVVVMWDAVAERLLYVRPWMVEAQTEEVL